MSSRLTHSLNVRPLVTLLLLSSATWADEAGFHFPEAEGFRVDKVAGDELAHDIYCMTLDYRGRPFVSGPGYIRRLEDRDGDGTFEAATEFFSGPRSGCMGMVFHGKYLYTTGGRGLERYEDRDRDGVADGPPRLLLRLATGGEHSSHALRIGPEGMLYFLGGNFCKLDHRQVGDFSPVKEHYAGIFCRMTLEAEAIEVWCEGMRNAYDFEFLPSGDVFGWDSDGERDEGLVWYRPCRLYHFTPGADCGWRSRGSGKIPTYALESVAPAAEVHRGSPTGVVCYRHTAFPQRYRGKLFALDWTLGRVYLFSPRPAGASFEAAVEVFLRADGDVSFAPTDIVLEPGGDLFISSGGRGIPGTIYRISYVGPGTLKKPAPPSGVSPLEEVLGAPYPLSAWSRARWMERARALGPAPFLEVLDDGSSTWLTLKLKGYITAAEARVRALDILVELFPASRARGIRRASRAPSSTVRARAAAYAGEHGDATDLIPLLEDIDPVVLRNAVESSTRIWHRKGERELLPRVFSLASTEDRRLRQAIIYSLTHVAAGKLPRAMTPGQRIVRGLALVRQTPRRTLSTEAVELALEVLSGEGSSQNDRLDGLRLLDASFDRLKEKENPESATFDSEWEKVDLTAWREPVRRSLATVRPLLELDSRVVFREALRLCGKLRDPDSESAVRAASRLSADSPVAGDMFCLWGLARLESSWKAETLDRVASAGLRLPEKISRQKIGRDNKWGQYQRAIWARLLDRHAELARRIVENRRFGDPEHLDLLGGAPRVSIDRACRLLTERPLPDSTASRQRVLSFLVENARGEQLQILRDRLPVHLEDPSLRPLALRGLARSPKEAHRQAFTDALSSRMPGLLGPALDGLSRLPIPQDSAEEVVELLRWGWTLDRDPSRLADRDRIAARLTRLSGEDCGYTMNSRDRQGPAFDGWTHWARQKFAANVSEIENALEEAAASEKLLDKLLAEVAGLRGDDERGRKIFENRSCGSCHHLRGKGQRVGPDLGDVGRRLGVRELLTEIVLPSKIVPRRYYFTEYLLRSGEQVSGMAVYSARNALQLITREGRYRRIEPGTIARSTTQPFSLMPNGLLDGLSSQEVADLVAYLRSPVKPPARDR